MPIDYTDGRFNNTKSGELPGVSCLEQSCWFHSSCWSWGFKKPAQASQQLFYLSVQVTYITDNQYFYSQFTVKYIRMVLKIPTIYIRMVFKFPNEPYKSIFYEWKIHKPLKKREF